LASHWHHSGGHDVRPDRSVMMLDLQRLSIPMYRLKINSFHDVTLLQIRRGLLTMNEAGNSIFRPRLRRDETPEEMKESDIDYLCGRLDEAEVADAPLFRRGTQWHRSQLELLEAIRRQVARMRQRIEETTNVNV